MGNLVFQATLGGQVNLVGPNTASTFNLNVPAVSSTISTTSGTETLTNKTLTTPVINGFTGDTSVVNIGSGQFYKDTSGNIGVGVTPSAWFANSKAIQLGQGSFIEGRANNYTVTEVGSNVYLNSSGNWTYLSTAAAALYQQNAGAHNWQIVGSGTAGTTASFTQAMTLDASGNLMVGTTSSAGRLTVATSTSVDAQVTIKAQTNNYASILNLEGANDNGAIYNYIASNTTGVTQHWKISGGGAANTMALATAGTERARIDSSGNLLVGKTAADTTNAGVWIYNAGGNGRLNVIKANSGTVSSIANYYSGTYVGGIDYSNTATSLVSSSDERLKENIVAAPQALEKVNAIEVVSYDWKHDPSHVEFGFVAQRLNTIYSEAVTQGDVGEEIEKTWGVEYGRLTPLLVKAIQEQQAIITQLQADVAALKG
jgi:hypothetical protein